RAAPPTTAPDAATQTPPATALPTEDLSILYEDDFSDDDSGWPLIQAENGLASYQSPDVYRLEMRAPGSLLQAARSGAFANFSLEASLAATGGAGEWRHGVTFRQIGPDNYYAFFVNPRAQSWQIAKREVGAWSLLAEGSSGAIPADPQPAATLRIDASGPSLTFSINGEGLVTVSDASLAAGDVGFVVETLTEGSVQLDVDSLVIRRFDAGQVPSAPTAVPVVPTETPTPAETATPTPTATTPRRTAAPTAGLLTALPSNVTALAATAASVAQTAAAIASQVPAVLTQACGLPGLPPCP
ncbi:MAG: hypothetical protein IT318_19090, partial [Anaerolineales bacterium]|nr:hypothetical protein [Anaerolineales bacterium]